MTPNFSEAAPAFLYASLLKATFVFTVAYAIAGAARRSSAR